jgi:hypothetical protein
MPASRADEAGRFLAATLATLMLGPLGVLGPRAALAQSNGPDAKQPLDARVLAAKQEGGYVTGLPLVNYDSNVGVGFGARAYYYRDGSRDDPRFQYTPYLQRVYGQAFVTTEGLQYHTIDYDVPYLLGSPYRLRAAAVFERNPVAYYFGRGASTLAPLAFPAQPGSFATLADYESALARVRPDGLTFARYDRYLFTRPVLGGSLERDLLGGAAGTTVQAPEAPTHLVVAARGVYSVQFGAVPFFEMNTLAFTDTDASGLGGLATLRGFAQDRFVGKVAAFCNLELRWTLFERSIGAQRFGLMVAPFVDAGRVFDDVRDTGLTGTRRGQGGAVRVVWNQATIVSVDCGLSDEGSGIYVSFGQQF